MKSTVINVDNQDPLAAINAFLVSLLESGFVDALLVPKALPGNGGSVQSLIKDPGMLEGANPLAPTMAVQSATILSDLTATPFEGRIGAVLKPCELRAAVELTKFLQVDLENVVTIGVDCPGTCEVKDLADMAEPDRAAAAKALVANAFAGEFDSDVDLREACRMCDNPAPVGADITLGLLGCGSANQVALFVADELSADLAEKLSLTFGDEKVPGRSDAIAKLAASRADARKQALVVLAERLGGPEKLMEAFATCVRCHNCMNVCPICYCKECVFKSATFDRKAAQLLTWADRKGAVRMPSDTLIFHLTRLSHMATSCVSCGMCDSACPSGLPVSSLFNLIGQELQEMFDYVPGRDANEEPPVSVFKEKELETTTGPH